MVNVEPYESGLNYIILAEKLISRGFKPYIVHLHAKQAVSATAVEFNVGSTTELSVVLSGSSSKVSIVSASTDDKSAATGDTMSVEFWGIDSDNNIAVETIATSGTTASSGTKVWRNINQPNCKTWGSGGKDAKGAINIGQIGKHTNEVFQIAANTNTIQNTRIWLPPKWRARIVDGFVGAGDGTTGRSTGILAFPHYYDGLNQDNDSSYENAAFFHENTQFREDTWASTYGNDTTMFKITFFGLQINNGDVWNIHARMLIWATHTIKGTSQNKTIAGLG
jgi:hypothetical protein